MCRVHVHVQVHVHTTQMHMHMHAWQEAAESLEEKLKARATAPLLQRVGSGMTMGGGKIAGAVGNVVGSAVHQV